MLPAIPVLLYLCARNGVSGTSWGRYVVDEVFDYQSPVVGGWLVVRVFFTGKVDRLFRAALLGAGQGATLIR